MLAPSNMFNELPAFVADLHIGDDVLEELGTLGMLHEGLGDVQDVVALGVLRLRGHVDSCEVLRPEACVLRKTVAEVDFRRPGRLTNRSECN